MYQEISFIQFWRFRGIFRVYNYLETFLPTGSFFPPRNKARALIIKLLKQNVIIDLSFLLKHVLCGQREAFFVGVSIDDILGTSLVLVVQ